MINIGKDILFLKSDEELVDSIKTALKDIQHTLYDYAVDNGFKGKLHLKSTCEELCLELLTDNFIRQLQLGKPFIEGLFSNLTDLKSDNEVYVSHLQDPVFHTIKTMPTTPWIKHVKQQFWLYLSYPLLLRLWQDKALLLPTDFKSNLKSLLLGNTDKFDKFFYETKLLLIDRNHSLKLAKGFLTISKNNPAREKEIRHRSLRFILATNWYDVPILTDLVEFYVVQSYYWEEWRKKKEKNVGQTNFSNLCHRYYYCRSFYNVIETFFRRGWFSACFPSLADEFRQQMRTGQLEAERLLLQQTVNITKEHLTDLTDAEAWDFWGTFKVGKRLYDTKGKFLFELLEIYTDIEKSQISNWILYAETYFKKKGSNKQSYRKNGFHHLLRYLLYLTSWFKNHKDITNLVFPKNFSLFTRSLYVIRQVNDPELPKTLESFVRDFTPKSSIYELGQFLRWMQQESSFQLEKGHSQSKALLLEKEFQVKWAEILKSEYSTEVEGDAKFAMNASDFTNLKHFMKTQEKYYMEVQNFIYRKVFEARLFPLNSNCKIIEGESLSQFLLRVSEQALKDLGWCSLDDMNAAYDKRLGIRPAIRNAPIGNKAWIEIDYKKSKRYLPKSCFRMKYFDTSTAKIKISYFKGKAPVNVPVHRVIHKDLDISFMLPSLSVLRPQLLAAELGIRHKHAFALDAVNFDSFVDTNIDEEIGVTTLQITTDKVETKPWLRPIDWSSMMMLWREVKFRKNYPSHFNINKHQYNDNVSFYCLFSFPDRADYASSSTRSEHWIKTLIAFSIHQSRIQNKNIRFCRYCPRDAKGKRDDQAPRMSFHPNHPLVLEAQSLINYKIKGTDGIETIVEVPYTKIALRAIHTPHSTRNAFISGLMGLMKLEDIACLVGQKSIATTVSYNQVTKEKFAKLQKSQRIIQTESGADSELAQRYKNDRAETARVHGFESTDIHDEDPDNYDANYNNKRPSGLVILQTANFEDIAFTDTHVCPYGMNCPDDIQKENGGYRKCAICRAKVVGFDHGPAIAKCIELTEINLLKAFIDHGKYRDIHGIDETNLKQTLSNNADEMAGWELTLQHLERRRQERLKEVKNGTFKSYMATPAMLDPSIILEKDKASVDEVLFSSIEDITTYRGLAASSPMLMDISRRIKTKILFSLARSNPCSVEEYLNEITDTDSSEATLLQVSGMIRTLISLKAIDRNQMLEMIHSERINYALPDSRKSSFLQVDKHTSEVLSLVEGYKNEEY